MINYTTLGSLITPAKVIRCGNDSFPVLSMTMHNGIVMQSERFKKKLASTDQSDYKVVKRGQLVVGFPIDEGVLYVQKAADEGIMSPAYNVWDIDSKVIDPDFLELCLHSPQSMQYYKNKLRGTTARRRSIPVSDLQALKIRLPDMQTQHEIVAIIKKAEAIIVDRQEQLDYFEQLVKSRFVELFGDPILNPMNWNERTVIEVCDCMVPGRDKPKSFTGDIPWITIEDLIINGVTKISKSGLGLTEKEINQVGRKTIPAGSIIMSCVGNLGICSIAGKEMVINQQLHSFQCGKNVNNIFLMHYLGYRKDYMNKWASNTTVLYMNKTICNSIPVIIPPLELQNQFAIFVKQIDKSKLAVQKSLDELETLKKSLMQQYFG